MVKTQLKPSNRVNTFQLGLNILTGLKVLTQLKPFNPVKTLLIFTGFG